MPLVFVTRVRSAPSIAGLFLESYGSHDSCCKQVIRSLPGVAGLGLRTNREVMGLSRTAVSSPWVKTQTSCQ
jgi:hypothetical protein